MVQNKNHTRKEADGRKGLEKGDKNQYGTNACKRQDRLCQAGLFLIKEHSRTETIFVCDGELALGRLLGYLCLPL